LGHTKRYSAEGRKAEPHPAQHLRHVVHVLHHADRERKVELGRAVERQAAQLGRAAERRGVVEHQAAQVRHVRETNAHRFEGGDAEAGRLQCTAQQQRARAHFEHMRSSRQGGQLAGNLRRAEAGLADLVGDERASIGRADGEVSRRAVEPPVD